MIILAYDEHALITNAKKYLAQSNMPVFLLELLYKSLLALFKYFNNS